MGFQPSSHSTVAITFDNTQFSSIWDISLNLQTKIDLLHIIIIGIFFHHTQLVSQRVAGIISGNFRVAIRGRWAKRAAQLPICPQTLNYPHTDTRSIIRLIKTAIVTSWLNRIRMLHSVKSLTRAQTGQENQFLAGCIACCHRTPFYWLFTIELRN